jgi:hypothetical protein
MILQLNVITTKPAATPIPTNSTALTNVVGNNVKCFTDTYGSVNFDITNNYATAVDVTYQVYESFTNNLIGGGNYGSCKYCCW